jgi:outer membrane lipoprotein-sorting protein
LKSRLALIALSAALAAIPAAAQSLTANDVLNKLEATQKNLKDFRARLVGTAATQDQNLKLDMEVQAIPSLQLVRVKFNAPDTLADNFVIIEKDTVYNYLFLTNQVTVSKINRESVAGFNFDLSQFGNLTGSIPRDKVNLKLTGTEDTPAGKAYVLEATPKPNADLNFGRAKVWALENGWRLYRFQAFDEANKLQADLTVSEWKTNLGLTAKALKALPKDAEVVKR